MTDLYNKCKDEWGVCSVGIVIGLVLMWILIFIWSKVLSEYFVDPNSLDPITQQLLQNHYKSDPKWTRVNGSEHFRSNEDKLLTTDLWK